MRVATVADASAIGRIHAESWSWAYEGLLPLPWLRRLEPGQLTRRWARRIHQLERTRSGCWLTVVEDRGEPIGFCLFGPAVHDAALQGMAAEVQMLYLAPECVGRGAGRLLFEHALEVLEAERWHWIVVWVLAANSRGRGFYEKAGLKLDGAARVENMGGASCRVVRYAAALNPAVDWDELRAELVGRSR